MPPTTRVRFNRYQRYKASGRCVDCGKPRKETVRCDVCRERVNRVTAEWHRRNRGTQRFEEKGYGS